MDARFTIAFLTAAVITAGALGGCAVQNGARQDGAAPAAPEGERSILVSSQPAAGSTVSGPVNELILHFNPPARLDEVTVTGPDGTMPMMITAVGETSRYSLPLSGLGAGAHTVNWRATAQAREYRGSFSFTVR